MYIESRAHYELQKAIQVMVASLCFYGIYHHHHLPRCRWGPLPKSCLAGVLTNGCTLTLPTIKNKVSPIRICVYLYFVFLHFVFLHFVFLLGVFIFPLWNIIFKFSIFNWQMDALLPCPQSRIRCHQYVFACIFVFLLGVFIFPNLRFKLSQLAKGGVSLLTIIMRFSFSYIYSWYFLKPFILISRPIKTQLNAALK